MAKPESGHKTEQQTGVRSTSSDRRQPLAYLLYIIIIIVAIVLVFGFVKYRNHSKYAARTRNEQLVSKVEYLSRHVDCKDALNQLKPFKLDKYTPQTQAKVLDYTMRCQALMEQYDKALKTGATLDKIYITQKNADQQKQLEQFMQIIKSAKDN